MSSSPMCLLQVLSVIVSVGNRMLNPEGGLSTLLLGGFSNFVRVVSLTYFLRTEKGRLVKTYIFFGARYEVLLEIQTFFKVNTVSIGKYLSTLFKALRVFERSVTVYQSTRRNVPEDMKLQFFRHVSVIWENSSSI